MCEEQQPAQPPCEQPCPAEVLPSQDAKQEPAAKAEPRNKKNHAAHTRAHKPKA